MASTNKTTNYELSQFEGTDKPSWEADYNADMLAIDTNLKAVSDIADGASGSISTLADRVTTAEGNITTNANDIDALEARADALEAGETAADGRLDALEAEQIVQNTAIESNTRLGYNLARPYDSASTYSVGAYVLFQDTLYKCTTAVTTGEAFDPTKWLAIKATDEIAAGGYTLPTASASTLGGVKVGSGLAIDGSGVLSAGNIIYLDNTNTTFSAFENANCLFQTGYYSGTYSTTNNTLTSPTIELIAAGDNFYAEIGNIAILSLYVKFTYDSIQIPARDRARYIFTTTINNSNIKAPSKTVRNINNGQPSELYNYSLITDAKKITFEFYFYNPQSTVTSDNRGLPVTFIYSIT